MAGKSPCGAKRFVLEKSIGSARSASHATSPKPGRREPKRFSVSGLDTRSVRRGLEEALRPGQPLGLKRSPVTGFLGRKRFGGNESLPLTLHRPIFLFCRLKGQPGRALRSFGRRRSASFFQPTGPEALPAGAPGKALAWVFRWEQVKRFAFQRVDPGI